MPSLVLFHKCRKDRREKDESSNVRKIAWFVVHTLPSMNRFYSKTTVFFPSTFLSTSGFSQTALDQASNTAGECMKKITLVESLLMT